MEINCFQFETLMNFYLDNELTESMRNAFEAHLMTCRPCREKYIAFKKIILDLRETYKKISYCVPTGNNVNSFENIDSYISAYLDNELSLDENIKIKKMIISKADIRAKVEKMYQLKILLQNNFNKTLPKEDYSKNLLKRIFSGINNNNNKDLVYAVMSFVILSFIWIFMLIASL